MSEELVQYIKKNLDAGYSEEAIKKQLLKNGWDEKKVRSAISKAKGSNSILLSLGVVMLLVIGGLTYMLLPSEQSQATFEQAEQEARSAQNVSEPECREIPDDYAMTQCFYKEAMNEEREFCDSENPQRCEEESFAMQFENKTACLEQMEETVIFCRQALVEAFEDKREAEVIESQTGQTV